jgi:putative membrane protein
MTTTFAALHHFAVLTLLVCTLFTIRQLFQPFSVRRARLMSTTDMFNGIAATLVLVIGLVRVFYFEKGSVYYFQNGPFMAKLGFYGLASILSVFTSVEVYRWRASLRSGILPKLSPEKMTVMRRVAALQLVCLIAMAACANLASRGIDWKM